MEAIKQLEKDGDRDLLKIVTSIKLKKEMVAEFVHLIGTVNNKN
jgi:hypothetical protein